jgi:hypothetical protein
MQATAPASAACHCYRCKSYHDICSRHFIAAGMRASSRCVLYVERCKHAQSHRLLALLLLLLLLLPGCVWLPAAVSSELHCAVEPTQRDGQAAGTHRRLQGARRGGAQARSRWLLLDRRPAIFNP